MWDNPVGVKLSLPYWFNLYVIHPAEPSYSLIYDSLIQVWLTDQNRDLYDSLTRIETKLH